MLNTQPGSLICHLRGCMATSLKSTWSLNRPGACNDPSSPRRTSECSFMSTVGHHWTVFSSICPCSRPHSASYINQLLAPLPCWLSIVTSIAELKDAQRPNIHSLGLSTYPSLGFYTVCMEPHQAMGSVLLSHGYLPQPTLLIGTPHHPRVR